MSATDELRRMLDERGVPYETNDDMGASETRWNGFTAYQLTPNAKLVMHPTPEQAIAVTLGNSRVKPPCDGGYCPLCGAIERTCHIVKNSRKYVLSDGRELFDDGCSICNGYVGDGDNYCSNCGARVVDR